MAQENLAGRTVSNYRLLERIGEGGTATVYRAEHPERGQCAVKILKPRLRNDPTAVQRFLREAEFGTRVRHPAVVQTYEYGQDDDLYFLALEWANGEPLADFVQRSRRLSPEVAAHITSQLAGGLTVAHRADIIHRDLKPENIIYDPKTQVVKLLDFGIARDAQADPSQRLTRTGFFVGTLQYVAPEALSGELVGPSADLYSLATITYYLLTGQHPFDARSARELFQQLLTTDPIPLNQAERGLRFSDALEKAVMRGLARDPNKRPSTAEDYAAGIEAALANSGKSEKGGIMGVFKGLLSRKE
jgi:eukaryotic-like serine/threonine-protein kinase